MVYEKIWQKVLNHHEEIKYEFTIGKRYTNIGAINTIIISLGLMLIFFPLGILLLIIGLFYNLFYLKRAKAYAFTTKRIVVHYGWLSTSTISVDYDKITDVRVNESIIEKVLAKTGDLSINTAGTSNVEIVLAHIDEPYEIKKKLDELKNK